MSTPTAVVPGTYQSHKGDLFEVHGVAEEPATGKKFVVYMSLGVAENLHAEEDPENPVPGKKVVRNGSKGVLAVATVEWFTAIVDTATGGKAPRFHLMSASQKA